MTQDKHIWCIIMAGGLGSRFWPVSRTDNPKQFIDVTGVGRSMLQLTFERYERICPKQNIVIVTGKQYADRVREQLPDLLPYQVLAEPLRRNTAPCIAYAADADALCIMRHCLHKGPDHIEAPYYTVRELC